MKRIALVHDFLYTYGGAERVLHALHTLYPDAPIYTAFAKPSVAEKHFPKAKIITSSLQKSPFRHFTLGIASRMPQAIEEFSFNEFDIVISSSGAFSHGIITGPQTHHISYCHSPMRYAWDWHSEFLAERGFNSAKLSGYLAESLLISNLRMWDQVSAKRVDTWLTNSQTVASRIKKFYHQEAQIVYPPIDTDYFDPTKITVSKAEPFLFVASRLSATKHVDWAIEAAAKTGMSLKIAGEGKERVTLEKMAQILKADIEFLGFVSEADKRDLLGTASAFIFPVEDDFGMAPVEALAMGTPVIAFGKGGATETVQHGKNGLHFQEPSVESLTQAVEQFLKKGVSYSPAEIRTSSLPFSRKNFNEAIQKLVDHE